MRNMSLRSKKTMLNGSSWEVEKASRALREERQPRVETMSATGWLFRTRLHRHFTASITTAVWKNVEF